MQVLPPSLPPLSLFLWFAGFDRFPRIPRSQWRERRQGEMDSSNLLCLKCTLHYNKHMKKADWFLLWKDLYDDFVQKHGHESICDYKRCWNNCVHGDSTTITHLENDSLAESGQKCVNMLGQRSSECTFHYIDTHLTVTFTCILLLTTFTFAFAFIFTLRQNLPLHLRLIYMVCIKIEVVSLKFDSAVKMRPVKLNPDWNYSVPD